MKKSFAQKLQKQLEYVPKIYDLSILGQNQEILHIDPFKLVYVTNAHQKVMKNLIHSSIKYNLTNLSTIQVEDYNHGFVQVKDFNKKKQIENQDQIEKGVLNLHQNDLEFDDFDIFLKPKIVKVFLNEIINSECEQCMPFLIANTRRFEKIIVQYLDLNGESQERELEKENGFMFQHHYDIFNSIWINNWRSNYGQLFTIKENSQLNSPHLQAYCLNFNQQIQTIKNQFPHLFQLYSIDYDKFQGKWIDFEKSKYKTQQMFSIESELTKKLERAMVKDMVKYMEKIQNAQEQ